MFRFADDKLGAYNSGLPGATMQAPNDRSIFLSTMPATGRDRAIALAVVCVSSALFACTVPFAGVPLAPVPAFVASYQSALAISDVITAVLLFSQFGILRRGHCCCLRAATCSPQRRRSFMP
jgi:hypothetical protein